MEVYPEKMDGTHHIMREKLLQAFLKALNMCALIYVDNKRGYMNIFYTSIRAKLGNTKFNYIGIYNNVIKSD